MAAALANSIPFVLAVLDSVALVVVLAFIVRGLLRAALGRRAWKTVLIVTTTYVAWANALLGFGLTAFNPGAYVIFLSALGWEVLKGTASPGILPSVTFRLLLLSWVGVAAVPTAVVAAVERVARRRSRP